ncbi:Stk1 family PASTA domain-containing Ser/Thr kinase [Alicyclobacillus fastidiosus]|uniref:non-specific serine/threonine protein kinase n=1 Tax=Alicyclobacillus fastidiosus TaxID=392011 RepID=A0ABY6ZC28_9BACL|nr:Stk1 family PASTA domain-containing Ser/Thr kinase [Alicyclobacillus fastidiosus]WAH40397.1 Stk1 family PASTA domain-containing Ser/Thr kinase [Alicyclobacillus fastidiosus]GMA61789.1 serine/threonine protein kinase [Alicyclobacillus fastidiosus]
MNTRILGGRYQLQEVIGGGGMAVVYRAVDTLLDRVVAIKMLRSQFVEDEEFVARFRQEAQNAARLSHPNIVNVYDVGVVDKEYYIVMEYVDGQTLKDMIVERAPLPVDEAIQLSVQICAALSHAHEQHIIHRDVKPHNILVNKFGVVKVTDFGIARAVTGNTITDRQATSVLGSVHYFSPEQARGAQTDAKSDIYSLGVVLYEMLTGSLPFSGPSPVSVALKHLREQFVEPRELNKAIPQSVENIILRCMVKAAEGRYDNMAAVKADLEDALKHPNVPKFQPSDDYDDKTIAVPVVGEGFSDVSPELRAARPKRSWRKVAMYTGIVVAAAAALAVGGYAAIVLVTNLVKVQNLNLPSVVGKPAATAMKSLEAAGFNPNQIQEDYEPNTSKPKGIVYDQSPTGNTQVKQTRQITLYISKGAPQVSMPDVTGQPYDQAKQSLVTAGFSANNITEQVEQSSTVPSGQVISSNPAAGQQVSTDGKIVLTVSQQENTTVPNLLGLSYADAVQALKNANLQVGQVTHNQVTNIPNNQVYYIYPYVEGQTVPAGSSVNLYVADNPQSSGDNSTRSDNSTDNGTGNATSTSGSAEPHQVSITVQANKGASTQVKIVIDDANGQNQVVVNQSIQKTTTWQETLYLNQGQKGDVKVYENGKLMNDYPVNG